MKKRNCPECGSEIVFLYETPTRAYRISDGKLIRDDNNISDNPELNPYCSNDKEHRIQPYDLEGDRKFWSWVDKVTMYFMERGIYEV